jgi:hypothetical protein
LKFESFHDKSSAEIRNRRYNIIKAIYDEPIARSILNGEKFETISSKARNEAGHPLSPLLFNIVLKFLVRATRQKSKIYGIQIEKEETKLSLFADKLILYLKDLKNSTKNLLDIINTFSKVAGYKINNQKSVPFIYTNNEQSEKEIRKTIPFTKASKKLKYLGINLAEKMTNLYNESYKSQKKEINKHIRRWKDIQ